MIPPNVTNPFIRHAVGKELTPPPGNVPDLHKEALRDIEALVTTVQKTGIGASVLVEGETGCGKSHLIAQLRRNLAESPTTLVLRIRFEGAFPNQIWRHVCNEFVGQLLAKVVYPKESTESGLERILKHTFPDWRKQGGISSILIGKKSASQQLHEQLTQFAEDVALSHQLKTVLPRLWDADASVRTAAGEWLRGTTLSEDDLRKLGLPTQYPNDYERETIAREIVLSICRLAVPATTLVICFDDVETMLAGSSDYTVLQQFAAIAASFIEVDDSPRVVVTFVRPTTYKMLREKVETSFLNKICPQASVIRIFPVKWEHLVQLVTARLHADTSCREQRKQHSHDAYWPFAEPFLREFFAIEKRVLTPRHLLMACRAWFDQIQKGQPPTIGMGGKRPPPPPVGEPVPLPVETENGNPDPNNKVIIQPVPDPNPVDGDFQEIHKRLTPMWRKRRTHHADHFLALRFDMTLGNGLRWLAELTKAPLKFNATIPTALADVNLVFDAVAPKRTSLGISFCNHEPGQLWRRLDRLIKQVSLNRESRILNRIMAVRAQDGPLSTATKTRIETLTGLGAEMVFLTKDQLLDLTTFHELHSKAQTGELVAIGRPVTPEIYDAWAVNNLTPTVRELVTSLFKLEPK